MSVIQKNINKDLIQFNEMSMPSSIIDLNNSELSSSNFDILVSYSDYNLSINQSILNGYLNFMIERKYDGKIGILKIPGGAFELPLLSSKIIRKYKPKLCLIIGCIVRGESQHYEFLASTTTNAIRNVAFENNIPVLNGVLTVESDQQAIDRAGKKLNKGAEYADASLGILNFSTVLARTNELGGIMHSDVFLDTKFEDLKFLGSTISEFTFVNILNSSDTLASYPKDDKP